MGVPVFFEALRAMRLRDWDGVRGIISRGDSLWIVSRHFANPGFLREIRLSGN